LAVAWVASSNYTTSSGVAVRCFFCFLFSLPWTLGKPQCWRDSKSNLQLLLKILSFSHSIILNTFYCIFGTFVRIILLAFSVLETTTLLCCYSYARPRGKGDGVKHCPMSVSQSFCPPRIAYGVAKLDT